MRGAATPAARAAAVAAVLLVAGCTSTLPVDTATWQLEDTHSTPAHVKTRDAATRDGGLAPPGSPRYAQFDAVMEAFMAAEGVPAGQLALMHDGRLIYASGYGHTNQDGTGPTDAQTMFRLASVTKPMTRALIALQVEEGLYEWDDPVFCLPPEPAAGCRIPLDPHPDHPVVDPRIADVTVEHLVAHTAGWGRTTDYLYRGEGTERIHAALGTTGPPTRLHAAQYLMGIELADAPGERYWYCNACYVLASLVAEAATGAHIGALFDAYLFRPLGVGGDIELGKAFPADRNPREPFYDTDYERQSAYDPNETVRAADGGFNIEMLAATGGLIATAPAVAAVYEAYPEHVPAGGMVRISGIDPYALTHEHREHGGLLDGTLAGSHWIDGPGGTLQFVFLFNSASPSNSCDDYELPTGGVYLEGCSILALEASLMDLMIAKGHERACC